MSESLILSLLDPNDVICQIFLELLDHVHYPFLKCDEICSNSFSYLYA